jgi:signal transduction histidine kinase
MPGPRIGVVPSLGIRAIPESRAHSDCHAETVGPGSSTGRGTNAAGVVAAATVTISVAALIIGAFVDYRLTQIGRSDLHQVSGAGVLFVFALVSSSAVGAALLVRQPGHPVGWCFAGLGMSIALAGTMQAYGVWGELARPGSLPASAAVANVADALFIIWNVLVGLVCYLTPTGRSISPRWAWCARLLVASGALWFATALVSTAPLEAPFGSVENPWGIEAISGPIRGVRSFGAFVNSALVLVAAASLIVRYRRAVGDERKQLLWMAVVAVPFPALLVIAFAASTTNNDGLLEVAAGSYLSLFPVAAAFAITKYHLYDVDRLLSKAVAYLIVSAVLACTYVAVIVFVAQGVGKAAGRSQIGIALATLAIAVMARPVYSAVQDNVDRRFSRRRFEAFRVVRRFVAEPTPNRTVEQVLRDALGDDSLSVSYWVPDRGQWVTCEGRLAHPSADALEVERAGRTVARVQFDANRAESELVRAVVHEAEPELDNAGLRAAVLLQLEEVRASRARITTAQLEERRRVERDLHDGAQQRLLALAAQMQAALLNGDPTRLRAALETGVSESKVAVRELRELANGLHPSVLSDGGLTAALDDLASRLPVHVRVAEPGRRYPPQVEATAWFIACEAITNAVKHAQAGRVEVAVNANHEELHVAVSDDGRGGANPEGRGLRGLVDRAEAIGGRVAVVPRANGGTSIRAVLPCAS